MELESSWFETIGQPWTPQSITIQTRAWRRTASHFQTSNVACRLQDSMVIEKAPDEASPSGLVRTRLAAFAARASEEREHVLHNNPVKVKEDEDTVVYFKAEAFIDYLRKTKSRDLRLGPDLWAALRAAGVTTGRFRANAKKVVNVWRMVLPADDTPEYQDHSFRSEM